MVRTGRKRDGVTGQIPGTHEKGITCPYVRSLSDVGIRILEGEFSSVREDLEKRTSGVPVVLPRAKAG